MICGALLESGFGDAVFDIVRHGFGWHIEDRRLIHVIPESGDSVVEKVFVKRSPPLARDLTGKVWKNGWTGPNGAGVDASVGILDEVVAGGTGVIRGVVGTR